MNLRRKYVLVLVGFALVVTLGVGLLSWQLTRGALERELDEKLVWVAGAAAVSGFVGDDLVLLRAGDEGARLHSFNRERLLGLLEYVDEAHIFRRDGTALVSTIDPSEQPIGTPLRWLEAYGPELETAWSDGQATSPLFRDASGRPYKYGFVRLNGSDAMIAVLMQADFLAPLDRLRSTLLGGALLAALLATVLAGILAGNIASPMERLSRVAIRIQRGHWDRPVGVERGDEIGRLSRAMERMRVGIVQRDEQLRLMLAQVAHEIRNPLGGLELFAAAAIDTDDPDERRRLLERVRTEVEGLNGIINDFLTFARPLHAEPRLHDVSTPLREAAELAAFPLRGNGARLHVELPDEPLLARADPDHVKRVALNLLQNAAQAGDAVHLRAWWHNGEVVVSVSDDGPGVPAELRERVFEPFVTDREQGAGLGLAIVKRILDTNGARVHLMDPEGPPPEGDPEPPIGEGAEFRVYFQGSDDLPAAEDEE